MKKFTMLILLALLALGVSACTNPSEATRVLEAQGYTNVQMTGYRWFMGSEDDTYVTGFKATGPTGKEVSGAVCSGLIGKQGATVRFD